MSLSIGWIKPWTGRSAAIFAAKAGVLLIALAIAGSYVGKRYRIAIDAQLTQCLPGNRLYLVDTYAKDVRRGDIVVFSARGLDRLIAQGHEATRGLTRSYRDGTKLVKRVAGGPRDHVVVSRERVTVNSRTVGEGLDLAATLARAPEAFARDERVPAGMYWVMGATRDSFDSRYWGYIDRAQIVGRAYALF